MSEIEIHHLRQAAAELGEANRNARREALIASAPAAMAAIAWLGVRKQRRAVLAQLHQLQEAAARQEAPVDVADEGVTADAEPDDGQP